MAMRPTSFELHIKTLFTEQDIKAMLDEGIDLLSYDDVKKTRPANPTGSQTADGVGF